MKHTDEWKREPKRHIQHIAGDYEQTQTRHKKAGTLPVTDTQTSTRVASPLPPTPPRRAVLAEAVNDNSSSAPQPRLISQRVSGSSATSGRTTIALFVREGLRTTVTVAWPSLVSSFYCLIGIESWWSHGTTDHKCAATFSGSVVCRRVAQVSGRRRVFVVKGGTNEQGRFLERNVAATEEQRTVGQFPFPPLPFPVFCHFVCMCVCF